MLKFNYFILIIFGIIAISIMVYGSLHGYGWIDGLVVAHQECVDYCSQSNVSCYC